MIEFRDPAWWNRGVYALLEEEHVGFCTVSGLEMPQEIVRTSDLAYFRFHGEHYSTRYPEAEMREYARRMREMTGGKVFAYFNNDHNAYAVQNAKELLGELNRSGPGGKGSVK
ncbi:MAG: DUF72 domain-containing protein [Candidatus Marinimicrobia bacterium]|nr:DUF72 domain-containing protein [Candidatus Neomarinimicrobiota bacterium]